MIPCKKYHILSKTDLVNSKLAISCLSPVLTDLVRVKVSYFSFLLLQHAYLTLSANRILFTAVQPQDQQTKVGHHKRTHFTVLQRRELEKIFSESQYLTPQKRESISQQMGITEEVIQVD